MQFTKQQLTGGPRYQPKARIGNWCEEIAVEELDFKSFKKNSAQETVNSTKRWLRNAKCLQQVSSAISITIQFNNSISGSTLLFF
jgi:hypothetical protein